MNCLLNETKTSIDSAISVSPTISNNSNHHNNNSTTTSNHNHNSNHNQNNNINSKLNSSNHNTTTTSSSNSQEPCLICGDVASGKHYGLRSCEACKAFFKRTVQGKIEYQCPASRECEINKRRRKACQACRFQKCLNMGMLKEGVRLDRVRGGRQKYRRGLSPVSSINWGSAAGNGGGGNNGGLGVSLPSTSGSSGMGGLNSGNGGAGIDSKVGILSCSSSYAGAGLGARAHHQVAGGNQTTGAGGGHSLGGDSLVTSETSKIMTALINCEPEELTVSPAQLVTNVPPTASVQMKTLYILSDLFDRELVSLIGWAKQIPGFSETITLNDQMRLLQSTWAEVIALSIGYRSQQHHHQQQLQQQQQSVNNLNTTPSPTSSSPASSASSYNHHQSSSNSSGGGGGGIDGCGSNGGGSSSASSSSYNLVFAKDLVIDFKLANVCGAEDIYYNCVQLIKRLDYLKITLKEYILLKAISLTNADVRLENPKATQQLRDLVMATLNEATLLSSENTTVVNHRLNQILLCLPILRQIDSCIRKFWNDVRKGSNSVPMNKLFEEMLEPCQKIYR